MQQLLDIYYEENPKGEQDERTEEADKVSVRITKLYWWKAFSFTPNEYISIHKKLFTAFTDMQDGCVIIILRKKNGP